MIYFWSGVASVLAVTMEMLFVRYSYSALWPWIAVPAVVLNWCVYQIIRCAPTLIDALAVFGFANVGLRVIASIALQQPVNRGTWLAAGCLAVANIVRRN